MTTRKHATIREIAKAAGVSTATVSRAFSKPEMLSPGTVEKVRQVAADLHYVPNRSARALSTGRQGAIAIIVSDIANPFFSPLIRGIERQCDSADVLVLLGDTDETAAKESTLLGKLLHQSDGVILAAPRSGDAELTAHARQTSMVLVNRDLDGVSQVLIDSAIGMRQAVAHLAELGHQHLVYAAGPADSWANGERRKAIMSAARRHKVKVTTLKALRPTHEAGIKLAPDVVASGATAVIAFDDILGQGIMAGIWAAGLSVPDDMSVIGCDDITAARSYPAMTAISADVIAAGERAAETLLEVIQEGRAQEPVIIPTRLVVRDSTGPARSR
ncbi:LacI family DNA-binding transcriptional regulator [Microlunatus sp. Y2014]|uniref:LacI family DNA-binding transcriptional regulator n=1 Tax=Microlunatus sp. Y2014 TaxID=3418488 RepID=UPI003DA79F5E